MHFLLSLLPTPSLLTNGQRLVMMRKKWPVPRQLLADLLYSRFLSPVSAWRTRRPAAIEAAARQAID